MNKNAIEELKTVDENKRLENIKKAVEKGVLIPCTHGVIIGDNAEISAGALVLEGSIILGNSTVGENSVIGPNSLLYNMKVGRDTHLNAFQGCEAEIMDGCDIGPFVHVRPNSVIKNSVHLGNFVEVKNSTVDEHTSVSHLTYVGDSDVGKYVNFGCGCVTVNYTGKAKFRTTVKDHCFIGCNTNLVAPVTVGEYGYTAAGSTITEDVPDNALAIARARQVNKINWVLKKKPYKGME
ncbi:MAG: UDP-N-acetylglucosamine diphosphorylase [Acutalibacteraceae bacterium]|nr:UDP-N-acetylglucosamine diphosphorylase [Oscillospiraceae bacterium]